MEGDGISLACPCGSWFAMVHDRHIHQQTRGHIVFCSCARPFKTEAQLQQHQVDTSHTGQKTALGLQKTAEASAADCFVCNKRCANEHGLKAHQEAKHPACPGCQQRFSSPAQRDGHQIVTGHCYCDEHHEAFDSLTAFHQHKSHANHVKTYECVDCDRCFASQRALDHHLDSAGHAATALALIEKAESAVVAVAQALAREEDNLRCEECNKNFQSVQGFRDHKNSEKHKPLSKLKCPLSTKCKKCFTSPSALLLHLESGGCKSGMNRLKLNVLIHKHDTDRQITHSKNEGSVMDSASAADAMPTASEVAISLEALSIAGLSIGSWGTEVAIDDTSSVGGLIANGDGSDTESISSGVLVLTPSLSRTSSTVGGCILTPGRSTSAWSLPSDNNITDLMTPSVTEASSRCEIAYDGTTKSWPCIIEACHKSFETRKRLEQHLYSPYHAPKLFHCPNNLAMGGEEHEKVFKTISGFAMHVEKGKCLGGEEVLDEIVGMFETKIELATGKGVKLLLGAQEV